MKEEKLNKNEATIPEKVADADFKNDAKGYLDKPTTYRSDTFSPDPKSAKVLAKNTANLANIVAAAQPPAKPKSKPKTKNRPRSKPSAKMKKKKPAAKPKKIYSFKIIRKNK